MDLQSLAPVGVLIGGGGGALAWARLSSQNRADRAKARLDDAQTSKTQMEGMNMLLAARQQMLDHALARVAELERDNANLREDRS